MRKWQNDGSNWRKGVYWMAVVIEKQEHSICLGCGEKHVYAITMTYRKNHCIQSSTLCTNCIEDIKQGMIFELE